MKFHKVKRHFWSKINAIRSRKAIQFLPLSANKKNQNALPPSAFFGASVHIPVPNCDAASLMPLAIYFWIVFPEIALGLQKYADKGTESSVFYCSLLVWLLIS